jgi:hypothetical protein
VTRRGNLIGAGRVAAVCGILLALVACNPTVQPQLTRYPYLTDLVGLSVTVNWATDTSGTTASARWGPVDSSGACSPTQPVTAKRTSITVGTTPEYQWASTLTLPQSGRYCYRVMLGSLDLLGTAASPTFLTQVPAGSSEPYSFAVLGDWGQTDANGDNVDTTRLMAQLANSGARFVVTTGDNGYPSGSQTNYGDLEQRGANVSAIFGPAFWSYPGRSLPMFVSPGNHGMSSGVSSRTSEQINWPQDVAVATSNGRYVRETYCCVNGTTSASYPSAWYAFDAGSARYYVLQASWADSNVGTGDIYTDDHAAHWTTDAAEYQWLQADLAAHPSGLKFAFFHFPLYSDQKHETSDTSLQGPGSLEGLLAAHNVSIAFTGHAHIYERNAPTGPGTFPSYVTGGGGGTLEPVGELQCSAFDVFAIGWSPTKGTGSACGSAPVPAAADQVFHFLLVTVDGTSVTVAPTDEMGRTFDVVTYDFSDSVLPDTYLDSTPPPVTSSTTATFTFHSSATDATYECSLDDAQPAPCTSPQTYTDLGEGDHHFSVRSIDKVGEDPATATDDFAVDLSPPSVPTDVKASTVLPRLVQLDWAASTDVTGVTGYTVWRDNARLATVAGTTTTFVDLDVSPSTSATYSVTAVDGAGHESAPSDPVAVVTPQPSTPVFADDFESGSLAAWTSTSGLVLQSAIVHAGAGALLGSTTVGNTYAKATLATSVTDGYLRVWVDVPSATDQVNLARLRNVSGDTIAYVFVTPTGVLGIHDELAGTNTLSATHLDPGSGWHSLEVHLSIDGAASTQQVWLDGVSVDDLSARAIDLGTAPIGGIQIGEVQSGRTYVVAFDDVAFDTARLGP